MWLLSRLIGLASVPMVGLVLPAAASPALGPQGPSASVGVTQVQYGEMQPAQPPALVQDDDDDDGDDGDDMAVQSDAVMRCAAQFRSFEPDTGYYTTYDGNRVLCPYLR